MPSQTAVAPPTPVVRRAYSGGLQPVHMRTLLDALEGSQAPILFAIGGTAITSYATPTSDVDFFFVGPSATAARVAEALWTRQGYDLELRDITWLERICDRLERYSANMACELPPFTQSDLRFLCRVERGQRIRVDPPMEEHLNRSATGLHRACTGYAAVLYVTLYQDLVGLLLAGRADEAFPLAGELIQRACLVALYQKGLVTDLAQKWAVRSVRDGNAGEEVARLTERVLAHAAAYRPQHAGEWVDSLLRGANAVVARALVERIAAARPVPPPAGPGAALDVRYTPIAALTGQAIYDAVARAISPCNMQTIAGMVQP